MRRTLLGSVLFFCVLIVLFCSSVAFAEEIPFLTRTYPQRDVKLRLLNDTESRVPAYAGPGTSYVSEWGYKPYKQVKITAYFIQDDWVFVDFKYQTVEERYLYLKKNKFESIPGDIPVLTSMPFYTGKVNEDVLPAWGPSSEFNRVDTYKVRAGTPIQAFFQENGYVYAEYSFNKKPIRMWLPADKVTLDNASVTITDETNKEYNISSFGKGSGKNYDGSYLPGEIDPVAGESNGRCPDHPNARINYKEFVGGYQDYDSDNHLKVSGFELTCSVCGREIYDSANTDMYDMGAHNYNQYGVCIYCGHNKGR